MDTTEKVIINVDLTNADYVRKAEETIAKMDALRVAQLKLKAEGQAGGVQWVSNQQSLQGLGRELKNYTSLANEASKAEKSMADASENVTLAYTSETGSINELRSRLSLLTAQRNAMSAADRDGTEAGQRLTEETRALSDQLKGLEKSVGDTRRNVGNYTESITDALAGTIPFGNEIVNTARNAQAMAGGITSGTGALKIFKVALASTGIGLLILAIAALVNHLKNLKPVMDAIEVATGAAKAVFDVFGRTVLDVGKSIVNALSSPLQLIKDIGSFLADPIEGFKNMGEAAATAGREMKQAAEEAAALVRAQQDQDDADRAAISNTAKLRLERDRLAVQAKNVSLTERQRIALLEQSSQKERQAFEIENANAKQRLANLKEQERQYLRNNNTIEASDEILDGIAQAQAEVYNLEATSLKFTEKRYNDQAKLREKEQAEAEKANAAEVKRQEKLAEAEQARVESVNNASAFTRTARQNELQAIDADIAERRKKFEKYGATTIALEKERIARINDLNKRYREADALEIEKNLQDIQDMTISRMTDTAARELAQIEINNSRKLAEQDKLIAKLVERETMGEQGLTELILSQRALRDEMLKSQQAEAFARDLEIKKSQDQQTYELGLEQVERNKELAEQRQLIRSEEEANIQAGIGLLQSVFAKESALGKAAFIAEKGFILAKIIMRTEEALAANRAAEQIQNAALSGIPIVGVGAAIANSIKMQAERARIRTAGFISGAAVIAATVQGFKDGVIDFNSDGMGSNVSGRGTGTSDSINARLSDGESVINARSTKMFKPLLSAINRAGGGRDLSDGYSGNAFAYGGYFSMSTPGDSVTRDLEISNYMMEAVKNIQVVVSVKDIITETNDVLKAQVRQNI